jgi:hypothetical protein
MRVVVRRRREEKELRNPMMEKSKGGKQYHL